jgi:hypothetical protein
MGGRRRKRGAGCLPVNAANARGSFRSVSCEVQGPEHECGARCKSNSCHIRWAAHLVGPTHLGHALKVDVVGGVDR